MNKGFWISTLLLISIGCNKTPQAKTEIYDPIIKEYESYRSGVIQINGATEVIEEIQSKVFDLKKKSSPSDQKYITQVLEQIDEARVCLADYCEDPLPIEKYKQQPTLRQQAVDAANDAIHELDDLYDIFEEAPKKFKLTQIETLVDESIKNLEESITTLGGKLEN